MLTATNWAATVIKRNELLVKILEAVNGLKLGDFRTIPMILLAMPMSF